MLEVGGGVIKRSFQKHRKTGGGERQKSVFVGGGGFEGVTTPAPQKNSYAGGRRQTNVSGGWRDFFRK